MTLAANLKKERIAIAYWFRRKRLRRGVKEETTNGAGNNWVAAELIEGPRAER